MCQKSSYQFTEAHDACSFLEIKGLRVRTIIVGSLSFDPPATLIEDAIRKSQYEVTEILATGSCGITPSVKEYAAKKRIKIRWFTDEIKSAHSLVARYRRLVVDADALIAILGGSDNTTTSMIHAARSQRLLVSVQRMEVQNGKPTRAQVRV